MEHALYILASPEVAVPWLPNLFLILEIPV